MKKCFWIFLIIFIAAAVMFGVCVTAEGIDTEDAAFGLGIFDGGISKMENENNTYVFSESQSDAVKNIDLGTISCNVIIEKSDDNTIYAEYIAYNRRISFICELDGATLRIKERTGWFTLFNFIHKTNELTLRLPDRMYDNASIGTISGEYNVRYLCAEDFKIASTSGDGNYNIFGNKLKISSVSGNNTITNCRGEKIKSLKVNSTSGDNTISGFRTDEFSLNSVSGNVSIKEVSGNGSTSTTSGNITLDFAEWSDDLKISSISGDYTIRLPQGSCANVTFDGASGEVRSRLDGSNVSIGKGSSGSIIGSGSNKHDIDIHLTSGDVTIENN